MIPEAVYGVLLAAGGAMAWAVRGRSATLLAPSVHRGPRTRRAIAVTFDDGPSPSTPELLDILDEHGARCTFFQVGKHVERLPEIARAVVARGHEIGNHSYSHSPFYLRHASFIEAELGLAQEAIAQAAGVTPLWFRAPYGARWFGLGEAQRRNGLSGVMWTAIALDWKLDAPAIHKRMKRSASNGAILCLHDGRELQPRPDISATLGAVRRLLPELRAGGYDLVTVSDLLKTN